MTDYRTANSVYNEEWARVSLETPEIIESQRHQLALLAVEAWARKSNDDTLMDALRCADKTLDTIRNAQGNTLNPHDISTDAFNTHELIRYVLNTR